MDAIKQPACQPKIEIDTHQATIVARLFDPERWHMRATRSEDGHAQPLMSPSQSASTCP